MSIWGKPGPLTKAVWRVTDRALQRCGLYVRSSIGHPSITANRLYRDAVLRAGGKADGTGSVIFDVGANLGQTAIEFARSFPGANIHAFEPVTRIFHHLTRNVSRFGRIACHKLALGDANTERRIALKSADAQCQINQVCCSADDRTPDRLVDVVQIVRLDDFCSEHQIRTIALLKTDTEGFDLHVLEGGATMLRERRIMSVMVEVSFAQDDTQHTHYDAVAPFLAEMHFALVGLYESYYVRKDGRMLYTNALFKLR